MIDYKKVSFFVFFAIFCGNVFGMEREKEKQSERLTQRLNVVIQYDRLAHSVTVNGKVVFELEDDLSAHDCLQKFFRYLYAGDFIKRKPKIRVDEEFSCDISIFYEQGGRYDRSYVGTQVLDFNDYVYPENLKSLFVTTFSHSVLRICNLPKGVEYNLCDLHDSVVYDVVANKGGGIIDDETFSSIYETVLKEEKETDRPRFYLLYDRMLLEIEKLKNLKKSKE